MTNGMVFCRGCGKEIHSSAPACPHCGAPGMHAAAGTAPPSPPNWPPAQPQPPAGYALYPQQNAWQQAAGAAQANPELRARLPMPPRLHWGLVLLFACLTFGIFAVVWWFIQSAWVKKIDPQNQATMYVAAGAASMVLSIFSSIAAASGASGLFSMFQSVFVIAEWACFIAGFFAIGKSLRERLPQYGYPIEINNVMLFFFTGLYVQSKLTALALWKETGFAGYGPAAYPPPVAAAPPMPWPAAQVPAPAQQTHYPAQPAYAPVPPVPVAVPVPQPVVAPEAPAPAAAGNVVRYDAQGNRIP